MSREVRIRCTTDEMDSILEAQLRKIGTVKRDTLGKYLEIFRGNILDEERNFRLHCAEGALRKLRGVHIQGVQNDFGRIIMTQYGVRPERGMDFVERGTGSVSYVREIIEAKIIQLNALFFTFFWQKMEELDNTRSQLQHLAADVDTMLNENPHILTDVKIIVDHLNQQGFTLVNAGELTSRTTADILRLGITLRFRSVTQGSREVRLYGPSGTLAVEVSMPDGDMGVGCNNAAQEFASEIADILAKASQRFGLPVSFLPGQSQMPRRPTDSALPLKRIYPHLGTQPPTQQRTNF